MWLRSMKANAAAWSNDWSSSCASHPIFRNCGISNAASARSKKTQGTGWAQSRRWPRRLRTAAMRRGRGFGCPEEAAEIQPRALRTWFYTCSGRAATSCLLELLYATASRAWCALPLGAKFWFACRFVRRLFVRVLRPARHRTCVDQRTGSCPAKALTREDAGADIP